ncbi:hypothetical protein TSUD_274130 [Trifolium subterraneum]|uniref:FORGETTER1 second zinc ribbon domain-containing protein n=1 Tax=Trifolium subterraneum TaxID=3900 RepID=A0A2Z6M0S6_TRISU|nr:hypothetical protein TSUD_274130 [Trifolium subterraneum]
MPPPPPAVRRARAAVWRIQQSLFPPQHKTEDFSTDPNYQMPDDFSTDPSDDWTLCPTCMTLVKLPNNLSKFRCPNCSVQRDDSDDGETEEDVNERMIT